jgi:hypothetical protein
VNGVAHTNILLKVLNYCVTSNHVHLLVYDSAAGDHIAKSVQ